MKSATAASGWLDSLVKCGSIYSFVVDIRGGDNVTMRLGAPENRILS